MIDIRLQGGEFDGTRDVLDETPNLIGAFRCPDCHGIHVAPYFMVKDEAAQEGIRVVRYMFVRRDNLGALYRYADLNLDGDPGVGIPEEEDEPLFAPEKEPELVPA